LVEAAASTVAPIADVPILHITGAVQARAGPTPIRIFAFMSD
jgi:hypothetical protein